jgi:hypothetical protein
VAQLWRRQSTEVDRGAEVAHGRGISTGSARSRALRVMPRDHVWHATAGTGILEAAVLLASVQSA